MVAIDERRRHLRHPFLALARHSGGVVEWTENLSAGGIFVRSETPPALGSTAELELSFPRWLAPLTFAGRVAWVRPSSAWQPAGFGIEVAKGAEPLQRLASLWLDQDQNPDKPACRLMVVRGELAPMATRGRAVVIPARTAAEAVEGLAMKQPDVVLVELYAPTTDCLRELRQIRERTERPVICLGSADRDVLDRALHGGADAVLPEGVSHTHVVQTLSCLKRFTAAGA